MTVIIRNTNLTVNPSAVETLDWTDKNRVLAEMPLLTEWWTAGEGQFYNGWQGRKNNNFLYKHVGTLPAAISGGPNSKKMITTGGNITLLASASNNLLPLNASFSLMFLARPLTNGTVFGNSTASADRLYFGYSGADPNQALIFAPKSTSLANITGVNSYAAGFQFYIASYEYISASSMTIITRRNAVQQNTSTADRSTFLLQSQRLVLFGTETSGTLRFNGDIVAAGVYNGAICASANANDLAAIESYISELYGIF